MEFIYCTIKGRHRYKLKASKSILNINHTFTVRKWCSVKLLRNVHPVIVLHQLNAALCKEVIFLPWVYPFIIKRFRADKLYNHLWIIIFLSLNLTRLCFKFIIIKQHSTVGHRLSHASQLSANTHRLKSSKRLTKLFFLYIYPFIYDHYFKTCFLHSTMYISYTHSYMGLVRSSTDDWFKSFANETSVVGVVILT